ncbi:unnamed protein product [Haemonchus placei]|uniref:G_PROTEIN_RECEP_F1_2 domain-containing protein n=1 Tax=Haemonchus placei TaxID=6290 RepID=A0A0N4W3K9_HAEPC|nr:unnamed protein product [Haemonchus placei]
MELVEDFAERGVVIVLETLLIGLTSAFGFLCNFVAFLIFIRHRALRNSFGYLSAYRALTNAGVLLILLLWATPWTIVKIPTSAQWLNELVGQMALLFMESCFLCSFVVSINRFVAVIYPTYYRKAFNERTTAAMLLLTTTLSLLHFGIYFVDGCSFYYDQKSDAWTFGTDLCSQNMALYIDMCFNIALFATSCVIDVVVFKRLRASTKRMMTTSSIHMDRTNRLRLRREALLFAQAILNSFLYSFMLLCFHLIAYFTTSLFGHFFFRTFVWSVAHTVDGLILIYLNPEIKRHLVGIRHFFQFIKDPVSSNAERVGPVYSTTVK